MANVNPNSTRLKLKGTTFQSVANGSTTIEIQQPGDCNTILGINVYAKNGAGTSIQTLSFTVNSTVILDGICAAEANPISNNSAKPYLAVNFPLAGSDSIKLSWSDTAAASYVINIYYLY